MANVTTEQTPLNDIDGYREEEGGIKFTHRLVLLTLIAMALTTLLAVGVCCAMWSLVDTSSSNNNETSLEMIPVECGPAANDPASPPNLTNTPPLTPASHTPPAHASPAAALTFAGEKGGMSFHHSC